MFRAWSVWARGLDGVQGLGLGGFRGSGFRTVVGL